MKQLFKIWMYTGFNWPISIRASSAEVAAKYGRQFGHVESVVLDVDCPRVTVECDDEGVLISSRRATSEGEA